MSYTSSHSTCCAYTNMIYNNHKLTQNNYTVIHRHTNLSLLINSCTHYLDNKQNFNNIYTMQNDKQLSDHRQ